MTVAAEGGLGERDLQTIALVLAVACGLTVANLYYSQPLLDPIAHTFHTSRASATTIVTATQLGYAAGLAFVLPLGDVVNNRRLAWRMPLVTSAALVGAALAPSLSAFLVLSFVVGLSSAVAQILVAFGAHLAPNARRGAFVGRVMSGLLVGILVARSFSSFVAAQLGWRSVYVISAVLMLGLAAVLARYLPNREPAHAARYRDLLASVAQLVRTEPVLRRRAIGQAVMFAVFSTYWTAIAYELVSGHGFSQNGIALFALVGAGGAIVAPAAGRLADRGHGRVASGLAFCVASAAMVLAGVGAGSVIALGLAGLLVDGAVQVHQLVSLQEIYALQPDARARVNTAFMTTVFVGGAIASACTGLVYKLDGWSGVTIFGALLPVLGLAVWWTGRAPVRDRDRTPQSALRSPGGSAVASGASDSPEIPCLNPRIP